MPRPAEPAGAFTSIEEIMSQATTTYRAVEATGPGKLRLTERTLVDPPAGHARIRVEACGVCHSDSGTVDGLFPIEWPRVPGHEAVGRIDALGAGVEGWAIGQRVGVGFLGRRRATALRRSYNLQRSSWLASEGGRSCRRAWRRGTRAPRCAIRAAHG